LAKTNLLMGEGNRVENGGGVMDFKKNEKTRLF
jgi:hypothetical protein